MTKNTNMNRYLLRRISSWMRSPGYFLEKAKDRFFGIDTSFFQDPREKYPPGSFEWLALTEQLYGGYQTTEIHRGGDRMSPHYHNYGRCYAEFLQPFLKAAASERFTLVEIGILKGNGLATWCDLFPNARVIGLDIDLTNFQANRPYMENLGAFQNNKPEIYDFDQLNPAKASKILHDILGEDRVEIAIDDGCHSLESIDITFQAIQPFLAGKFVCFIEDNFDTYDHLAHRYRQYYWTTRGEIAVAKSRES